MAGSALARIFHEGFVLRVDLAEQPVRSFADDSPEAMVQEGSFRMLDQIESEGEQDKPLRLKNDHNSPMPLRARHVSGKSTSHCAICGPGH